MIDSAKFPATAEVLKWIENEKKNGLVDIKFDVAVNSSSTLESFSKDVLGMIKAETLPSILS